jgi:hypothetical protein
MVLSVLIRVCTAVALVCWVAGGVCLLRAARTVDESAMSASERFFRLRMWTKLTAQGNRLYRWAFVLSLSGIAAFLIAALLLALR